MARELRYPGERDDEFRERAERACELAKVLVRAALANHCVQEYIADPQYEPWTEASQRRSPTVRVEYEQAIAYGSIGEALAATKSKHWGDGPQIMPLEPDDFIYPVRLTYKYRENSLYNRRFEQRMKLKQLLGKERKLVSTARGHTQAVFLHCLTPRQAFLLRRGVNLEPADFWAAVNGRYFPELPEKIKYVSPVLLCTLPKKKTQLRLPFKS